MSLFSRAFWAFAFERAVKTVAQSGLSVIGANSLGIVAVDWRGIGSVAALAGLVSVLTSLTSFSGGGAAVVLSSLPTPAAAPPATPAAMFPALVPLTSPAVTVLTPTPTISFLPPGSTAPAPLPAP